MTQENDILTAEQPPAQKRRGRPVTGTAQTNAERQKAYRQRLKQYIQTPAQKTIADTKDAVISVLKAEVASLKQQLDNKLNNTLIIDTGDAVIQTLRERVGRQEQQLAEANQEIGRLSYQLSRAIDENERLKTCLIGPSRSEAAIWRHIGVLWPILTENDFLHGSDFKVNTTLGLKMKDNSK